MNQLILAVAAVFVESHVTAFLQALIGKAKLAGTALPAKIHQEYDASRSDRGMSAGTGDYNRASGLMTRRGKSAVEELRSFRTAKRVGVDSHQELPRTRLRNRFIAELNLFIPDKDGNTAAGRYGFAHKINLPKNAAGAVATGNIHVPPDAHHWSDSQ